MVSGRPVERGQVAAELAVVLPVLMVAVLGVIQLALVACGSVVARHAAFTGARAAATADSFDRAGVATAAASSLVSRVPGFRFLSAELRATPLPLRGLETGYRERMTCRVSATIVKLVPLPGRFVVSASCSLPMEAAW
jgi:Flp pilus assembly protein TadG